MWIRLTKKILVEEGHVPAQLIHILGLLVRHPALFYPARSHFIPHIITAIPRIGLLQNAAHDNRKLSVDLVELVLNWEKQRLDAVAAKKEEQEKMQLDNPEGAQNEQEETIAGAPQVGDYKLTPQTAEMIVSFLIRIAAGYTKRQT